MDMLTHAVSFQNGTGLYKKIWQRMEKQDIYPLIESTEDGMKLVRDEKNIALIGGRETFFFDTRRFGTNPQHHTLTNTC